MERNVKTLNKKIDALGKRTAKWRDEVQLVLVECAIFAFDDKNVDPCTRLVKALTGAESKALVRWIEGHMPAVWMSKEEKFRFNKSFNGVYDAITLMAEPWWHLVTKLKNVPSSIDALESFRQLIARLNKEVEKGEKTVENADFLAAMVAAANDWQYKKEKEEAVA